MPKCPLSLKTFIPPLYSAPAPGMKIVNPYRACGMILHESGLCYRIWRHCTVSWYHFLKFNGASKILVVRLYLQGWNCILFLCSLIFFDVKCKFIMWKGPLRGRTEQILGARNSYFSRAAPVWNLLVHIKKSLYNRLLSLLTSCALYTVYEKKANFCVSEKELESQKLYFC